VSAYFGTYYDGRSSRAHAVTCRLDAGRLRITGDEVARDEALEDVVASARLGRAARVLRLADGACVEIADSDSLETALAPVRRHGAPRFVAVLERHWGIALASVAIAVAAIGWAVVFGVPALARDVAFRLPPEVSKSLGEETLEQLDDLFFEPSSVEASQQASLRERFDRLQALAHVEPAPHLEFRAAPQLGANAFALPSGDVVLTDGLVENAEDEDEIVAVLAHELGHVQHRHGLRSVLQQVGIGALVAGALGDFVSLTSIAGVLPVLLVTLEYGREFEREADAFGADLLDEAGIGREKLAQFLTKLAAEEASLPAYLSTHPATTKRAETIRRSAPER
jgi:Zn-dependent protease with chaperone function